jgi:hypothetical protein
MSDIERHTVEGFNQKTRYNRLVPNTFKPYNLSLWDHLVYSENFAGLLQYYNVNNKSSHTWEQLLATNSLSVLAEIITFDLKSYNDEFDLLFDMHFENENVFRSKTTSCIFIIAERLNSWYTRLVKEEYKNNSILIKQLKQFISRRLKGKYQILKEIINANKDLADSNTFNFSVFDQIWDIPDNEINISAHDEKREIKRIFHAFGNVIEYLKSQAGSYSESLLKNGDTTPHISLLVAFFKLLNYASNSINNFNNRHSDFLFNEILRSNSHNEISDKLFLLFNKTQLKYPVIIKKDQEFIAGKDEEVKDLIYKTESGSYVYPAEVKQICSLYFGKQKEISPGGELSFVTEIKKQQIDVPENILDEPLNAYSFFGQDNICDNLYDAKIGFAISDSNLYLYEGQRNIHITLMISESSYNSMIDQIESAASVLKKNEKEVAINVINNAFNLYITTCEGIEQITNYRVNTSYLQNKDDNKLEFIINLDNDFPPIENSDIDGYNLPTIIFEINPQSSIFPYSILKNLNVKYFEIDVEVHGVLNLLIYNQFGMVDMQSPYYPFGLNPIPHSEMIVGNFEMSQKKISSMGFEIEWAGLPQNEGGFGKYYAAYNNKLLIDSMFKIDVEILNNGKWKTPENNTDNTYNLFTISEFTTKDEDIVTRLEDSTEIENITCGNNWQIQKIADRDNYKYDVFARDGFIRFKLVSPECGFGQNLYTEALALVMKQNARRKKQLPLPATPYVPTIKGLRFNYTANSKIVFESLGTNEENKNSDFHYIQPFGKQKRLLSQSLDGPNLIPEYLHDGYLYIGIKSQNILEVISIYFQIRNDSYVDTASQMPTILWSILSDNSWNQFTDNQIISDGTMGLIETGIIQFRLPDNYTTNNTILKSGIIWIRAAVTGELSGYSPCELIHLNASKLVWVNKNNKGEHLDHGIAKGSVTKSSKPIVGLNGFNQLNQSFGGKPTEDKTSIRMRLKETMYHKNRAVTANDYELMILQKFPEINMAKCFHHISLSGSISPGSVLIAVIPFLTNEFTYSGFGIKATNSLLQKVIKYTRSISADSVKIDVRNPEYEKIQIRCKVRFSDIYLKGEAIGLFEQDINNYLANWLYDNTKSAFLGKGFHLRDIFSFLSNLEYVRYLTGFSIVHIYKTNPDIYGLSDSCGEQKKVYQYQNNSQKNDSEQSEIIQPYNIWSAFIPSLNHRIEELNKTKFINPQKAGLETLQIEEDFIIQ